MVLDTSDPEWWQVSRLVWNNQTYSDVLFWVQGNKLDGNIGLFPSASVAKLHPNEKLVQILQNLQLREGNKVLRLYRDQVRLESSSLQ